jgi:hypothetical protein
MYRCGLVPAVEVIDAATDLLASGLEDSLELAALAGTPRHSVSVEMPVLLPPAMASIGLPLYDPDTDECQFLAAAGLAELHLGGGITARQLTNAVHSRFGHEAHRLVARLADLDDSYDTIEYSPDTEEDLNDAVHAAADKLTTVAAEIVADPSIGSDVLERHRHAAGDEVADAVPNPGSGATKDVLLSLLSRGLDWLKG